MVPEERRARREAVAQMYETLDRRQINRCLGPCKCRFFGRLIGRENTAVEKDTECEDEHDEENRVREKTEGIVEIGAEPACRGSGGMGNERCWYRWRKHFAFSIPREIMIATRNTRNCGQ